MHAEIDELTKKYQELLAENDRLKTANREYEKKLRAIKKSFDSMYDNLAG